MVELTGLSRAEVVDRRDHGLVNAVPDDTGRSFARILVANVLTVFNAVVGGCFVLLLVLGAWQDALFGFFVIANTAIGVVQEFRAKRTLTRLAVLNAPGATVRRDGADVEVAPDQIVIDDLLVLRPGDQLPVDALLLESHDLEVDESLLTGEADPVSAGEGRELLSGSSVVTGSGLARAIRVGANSYAARLSAEARQFSLVSSELRSSIARIIRWLSLALVPVGVLVVNGQMQALGGWSAAIASGAWRDAAVTSTASIIALVPAGLVFMTSVALALGAVRLVGERVLVRELAAVEGLARVDLLCIDKTGTLTEGGLVLDRAEPVEGAPDGWQNALAWLAADPAANATARAAGATFVRIDDDAPDGAVAFSSRHKWSAIRFAAGRSPGTWVLGGADVVLRGPAAAHPASARAGEVAAAGERTLVLAHSPQPIPPATGHDPRLPDDLEPVAVLVFHEEVRAEAAETLRYFADQGVDVCVMSGDDPSTVAAVARRVGLAAETGRDARTLPTEPDALAEILRTERVFGRVTPPQKKEMILALRSLGHTVAMIGDGVNDTLALKHAHLGVAMGSGSPAARAVAQLVLLDGSFARLARVLGEGRQVVANVERLAQLFLSKTVYAMVFAVTFGILLWPFPFLPRQLSVVDGLTIGLPAIVLALLPNTAISRPGFLRRAARFCIPAGLIVAAAVIAVVGWASTVPELTTPELHTTAVIALTLSAVWVLSLLSRPLTRITGAVIVTAYAGLALVLAVPLSRDFLDLELPPLEVILVAVGVSALASIALEIVHRILARRSA